MKICYLANIRMPTEKAHGIQIMKMCEAFSEQGIAVNLLVPRRWNDLLADPFDFYKVKRNFVIKRMPAFDFVDIHKIGFFLSAVSFLLFARIYLFLKGCDVLYTREWLTSIFFKNFVLEIHAIPRKVNWFFRWSLRRARQIVVITNALKEEVAGLGTSKEKILVLPDSVDLKEFDIAISKEKARQKLNLPEDKKIILYTGSFLFYDWKGADLLLEAADKLGEDYLVILVGAHPHELVKIKERYPETRAMILPFLRRENIPFYLKAADILVIPNKAGNPISEKYTSPLKLFEYMASQRPIISSDLLSLREILTDKEAVFFTASSEKGLIAAIQTISGNQELAEQLSFNAYQKVQRYTWEERASRLIKSWSQ